MRLLNRTVSRRAAPVATLLALGLAAAPAAAQEEGGYYVGVGAGYNMPVDSDADGTGFSQEVDYNDQLGVLMGTLGYAYDSNWRGELEVSRRSNDVDSIGGAPGTGNVEATGLMANVLYDFHGLAEGVTPYLGAGLGLVHLKADTINPVNGATSNSSDDVPAGQLIAGAAFDVAENVAVTGQYNFLATTEASLDNRAGQGYDLDYATHSLTIGLRIAFGAPDPAPKAEPEPEPEPAAEPDTSLVRNFLVFFDWDDATVTAEAREVLRQATQYAEEGEVVRITLTGHADTSGPSTYNMRLSQRRAEAVEAALRDLGFDGSIDTVARGEEQPLVPTGDGVREPQNRRVEIVLQPTG